MKPNYKDAIINLLFKYLNGKISEEEKVFLDAWRKDSIRNEQLFQRVSSRAYLEKNLQRCLLPEPELNKEWEKIRKHTIVRNKFQKVKYIFRYAAVLLIPLGIFMMYNIRKEESQITVSLTIPSPEPGMTKATLKLANGQAVNLTEFSGNEIKIDGASKLQKSGDTLQYETGSPLANDTVMEYNTLSIPRGAEYHVVLSDGSTIYLNSESSLRYPVKFKGNKREVELKGEAYFDIARDSRKAFIVHVNDMEVKVLGTSFGIRAYDEEAEILTTLVHGSVNVRTKDAEVHLNPSQQAVYKTNGKNIDVQTVNVEHFVGWKSGRFIFDNLRLEDILNRLQKWYDFKVFYQNQESKDLRFSVNLIRYNDFTGFLKALERTESVKFEIKGKAIVVKSVH